MGEFTKEFTSDNFDAEVIKCEKPVLVDFWAEWCGPCKQISPTVDQVATEYQGKAIIGKVNILFLESKNSFKLLVGISSFIEKKLDTTFEF